MTSSCEYLNEQLWQQLECNVCLVTCLPPIYTCRNGHVACNPCRQQIQSCGECRAPGKPSTRSNLLEDIANLLPFPCPNKQHGCAFKDSPNNITKHLPECEFGFLCHICGIKIGVRSELADHVDQRHLLDHLVLPADGLKRMKTGMFHRAIKSGQEENTCLLISFQKALFWYELSFDPASRIVVSAVFMVNKDPSAAAGYFYKLTFFSRDWRTRVSYESYVISITESTKASVTDFVLPREIVDSYIDDNQVDLDLSIFVD